MANESLNKTADWAPGTLDKTRKAIGDIDPQEAATMAKKLGGEVLNERSILTDPSSKGITHARRPAPIPSRSASGTSSGNRAKPSDARTSQHTAVKHRRKNDLQMLPPKLCAEIDKLMMSDEYQIKANYGIFNFIRRFQKDGTEKILPAFYDVTLKLYIDQMEAFITVIKMLIQMAPNTYKAKIAGGADIKFKFLRTVAGWTMQDIKFSYDDLFALPQPLLVCDLIPFIRAVYRPLMTVYYYGSSKIPKIIKEIYADEIVYPDTDKEKLQSLAKEAITKWLYIDTEIIRKLYPLLMRMCSDTYEAYPVFFSAKVADILQFIGLHKFDLLLPDKPKEAKAPERKENIVHEVRGKRDETVNTGLNLLDRLFPEAGFQKLDMHPDLFPYFQPLYKFDDGFNILSPSNPIQLTIVLLRIIEDFFQGCRNISFVKEETGSAQSDSIDAVLDTWSAYREDVFNKLYAEPLIYFTNQIYSQSDFEASSFGKKSITALLWQAQYQFLPELKFKPLVLERPANDSKYPPLYKRVDFVRKYLTRAANACDAVAHVHGTVDSIRNPWEHYRFDIPNEISKRLDVLLGAQNTTATTNATNANLLKYTLCIVAVLDWWLNNPDSPAYSVPPTQIYRISEEDGKPQFSVPERHDQNKLFAEAIRTAYQKK
ncbi:hypothetical protein [Treponema socranskii]|uniref:hypothetical protein n=1 Tax=Treponema socranskii TaxID=53419 RepID=UPI00287105A1|nr:hypothetical protein [Treponema socranskii]MDR9860280.1 hypothetical protein [Treponema socranskii]